MNPEERITGPASGYWIATFAYSVGSEFIGGARVFPVRPRSYREEGAVTEVFCPKSVVTIEDAHAAALELAAAELHRLR